MAKKKRAAKKKPARRKAAKGAWNAKDLNILKKQFADISTADIAKKVGRKVDAVKKKASRMGIKKSKRYLKSIGRA
ncbi:MAG: hypothetical protein JW804_05865 [Sedimentisphaerales bacterium]|nr:hypothetical protein [Sedimentisphaerales bacterium]